MALKLGSNITASKIQVGLGNVDNIQQLPLSYLDTDDTLMADSDEKVASQKAIKGYVDGEVTTLSTSISGVSSSLGTHTSDAAKHREINDSGTGSEDLWSASKISTEVGNLAAGISSRIATPVSDVTALKAVDTTSADSYPDKIIVNVEDKGLYRLDRDSSETGDDDRVVAPTTGVGRWLKLSSSINDHNNLSNTQGGTTGEKYHLTSDQHDACAGTGTPSSSNKFMTSDMLKLNAYSDISGLAAADNYLNIIKVQSHATLPDGIYMSDGTNWVGVFVIQA